MIILKVGNVGSGKTLKTVIDMVQNPQKMHYTNIQTKKIKNNTNITSDMIMKKTLLRTQKHRDGTQTPVYEYKPNIEYWQKIRPGSDIILDEIHTILSARRSQSKQNQIITDWLALIRKIVGSMKNSDLILISQLTRRIDIIAREMAHNIHHHTCHWQKTCPRCGLTWQENSDMPELIKICPRCRHHNLHETGHYIITYKFGGISNYEAWKDYGAKTYYTRTITTKIDQYFNYYNTYQLDNLFTNY